MQTDMNGVIDRVAQELTSAEPPVNLRARVMQRIDAQPIRPRLSWDWRFALVPVAVAAVIFVVARQRPDTQIATPARQAARAENPPNVNLAQGPTSTPASNSASRDAKPGRSRTRDNRIHRANAEELAWRERAISALTPLDPLNLQDIQPTALSIPQLEVKPLGSVADGGSPGGGSPNDRR